MRKIDFEDVLLVLTLIVSICFLVLILYYGG